MSDELRNAIKKECPDCGSEDIEEEGETFIDEVCQDCGRVVAGGRLASDPDTETKQAEELGFVEIGFGENQHVELLLVDDESGKSWTVESADEVGRYELIRVVDDE